MLRLVVDNGSKAEAAAPRPGPPAPSAERWSLAAAVNARCFEALLWLWSAYCVGLHLYADPEAADPSSGARPRAHARSDVSRRGVEAFSDWPEGR